MQSEMNVGVVQQNEERHQDDMDELTKKKIIDDTDDSFHNQQPAMSESAMEWIEVDLDSKNQIGQFDDIWSFRLDCNNETSESSAESDEEYNEMFQKYHIFHEKKTAFLTEESLKAKSNPILEPEITSQTSMANISISSITNIFSNANVSANTNVFSNDNKPLDIESLEEDICSKFETLLANIKIQSKLTPKHKKTKAACDNRESNQYVKNSQDSSSKNEYELNVDHQFYTKAGSSEDFTDTIKSKYELKTSENIQSDCEENDSISESSKKGFKNLKWDNKDRKPASKSSLKRSCDSQSEVPSVKYRRRCSSTTKTGNTGEENNSRHRVRCISANDKKCSADRAIGQAAGSRDDIKIFSSRKRKIDKGPKSLIEEFSLNTKKFKQNESAFKELRLKECSTSNEGSN